MSNKVKVDIEELRDIQSYIRGARNGLENEEDDVSMSQIINLLRDSHEWIENIIQNNQI